MPDLTLLGKEQGARVEKEDFLSSPKYCKRVLKKMTSTTFAMRIGGSEVWNGWCEKVLVQMSLGHERNDMLR